MLKIEVSVTSAPCLAEIVGHIVRQMPGDGCFGIGRLGVLDMAETTRHGCHVDRGITTTDHHHALADVLQATVVERLQESGRSHDVGRIAIGDGQRATSLGTHAEEHCIEFLADLVPA